MLICRRTNIWDLKDLYHLRDFTRAAYLRDVLVNQFVGLDTADLSPEQIAASLQLAETNEAQGKTLVKLDAPDFPAGGPPSFAPPKGPTIRHRTRPVKFAASEKPIETEETPKTLESIEGRDPTATEFPALTGSPAGFP